MHPTKNETPQSLFNPLKNDFNIEMLNDQNEVISFTIRAHESESFPTYIADHIEKHLIQQIFNEEGKWDFDQDIQKEEIRKRVEMIDL